MTSHSQAAVTVSFNQVGNDVVATWSGSFDAGTWFEDFISVSFSTASPSSMMGLEGSAVESYSDGSDTLLLGFGGTITSYVGSAGWYDGYFNMAGSDNNLAPVSTVYDFDVINVSQTFGNQTLADIGATSFNNTLAWTSSAGGTNTISYTTVPELSSTALIGLGALALAVRRRR